MAITSETSAVEYEGNDSTSTAYVVPFLFFSNAHLKVTVTDADDVATVLALTTDYAVTGANNPSGGTVTTMEAYDDTHTVRIERVVPVTQPFVYEEGGRLPMKTLEKNFDTLAMQVQQLHRAVDEIELMPGPTGATGPAGADGADGAEPTTESVLALLEGAELPVVAIDLGDASALTLATGRLSGDGAGGAVVGDGETLGGNRLAFYSEAMPALLEYNDPSITAEAGGDDTYFVQLGTIDIPVGAQVEGTSIELEIDITIKATCNAMNALGIAFKKTTEADIAGNLWAVASTSKGIHTFRGKADLTLTRDVIDPPDFILGEGIPMLIASSFDAGGTFSTPAIGLRTSGFDYSAGYPIAATTMEFGIYIGTSESAITSGSINAVYSFRATLVTP